MAKRLIPTIFGEGTISTLYGVPGAGKTSVACVFMEKLYEYGYNVWTIVHFFRYEQVEEAIKENRLRKFPNHVYRKKPEEVHTIGKISELLIGLLSQDKNAVILDEAGIFGSSTSPMSSRVRTLKQLGFIIRHLNASMMLIAQSKGSLAPDLRETLTTYELRIRRLEYSRLLSIAGSQNYIDEFGEERTEFIISDEYRGIPPTHYPFDSKYMPKFTIDIDLSEALDRLGDYNSLDLKKGQLGVKIIEELLEEEDDNEKDDKPSKRHITERFKDLLDDGHAKMECYSMIAEEVGMSVSWVRQNLLPTAVLKKEED